MTVYEEIFEVIKKRKAEFDSGTAQENSYTCYLFEKGVDKICKKIGEEATETVIAAKNKNNNELKNEINDLLYHIMVLCVNQGLEWSDVEKVLDEVIFINQGQVVLQSSVDEIREEKGMSVDALFREVFKC